MILKTAKLYCKIRYTVSTSVGIRWFHSWVSASCDFISVHVTRLFLVCKIKTCQKTSLAQFRGQGADPIWMSSYQYHYNDVIIGTIASQITSLTIVYSTVYSDADQRKHQSSASLAFVREIHRGPLNSPHEWPVTRNMFPFDDVIMIGIPIEKRRFHIRPISKMVISFTGKTTIRAQVASDIGIDLVYPGLSYTDAGSVKFPGL